MAYIQPPYGIKPRELGNRPAYGLYIRCVKDFLLEDAWFGVEQPDLRPALVIEQAEHVSLRKISTSRGKRKYDIQTRKVTGFTLNASPGLRVETRD